MSELRKALLTGLVLLGALTVESMAADYRIRFSGAAGKSVTTLSTDEFRKIFKAEQVTVFHPSEKKLVSYKAYPVLEVLAHVYGPVAKLPEVIAWRTHGGGKVFVPRSYLEAHRAYLAFEREDAILDGGPLKLIWANLKDERLKSQGGYNWVDGIAGVELAPMKARFQNMMPPEPTSDAILRGFHLYQAHCMGCHKMNGVGGKVGPELKNWVGVISREYLMQWLDQPKSGTPHAKMPALSRTIKNRKDAILDLVSYLKAMDEHLNSGSSAPAGAAVGQDPDGVE